MEEEMPPTLVCRTPTATEELILEEIAQKLGRSFAECKKTTWMGPDEYLILHGERVIGYAALLRDTTGWSEELTPEIQAYLLDPEFVSYFQSVYRMLKNELKTPWW